MTSLSPMTRERQILLSGILRRYERVAIGFSGGVDSSFLLWSALDVLGPDKVLALLADTPTLPRSEFHSALALVRQLGATLCIVQPNELAIPEYVANPPDRCYLCKTRIFSLLKETAQVRGFPILLDGSNADDVHDSRPGHRALHELGIKSPLLDAGLSKADIRALSVQAGLPTAHKPSLACLATRIPFGSPITQSALATIEQAEAHLRAAGFDQCRVRHYGELAKIEIPETELERFVARRAELIPGIRSAGYRFVALDLQGYKTGNLNPL